VTFPHPESLANETLHHLQALIRLNTVNPPGNEILAADYIARVLRDEGIEPLVLESAPARGNVIARLKGSGELPPLLLYGHTDVVGVESEKWTHPPFEGIIADDFIWGRGALDMKGFVAQQLTVFLNLKRHAKLKRDVIFLAAADEEIGGKDGYGMAWLVKNHSELLRAEFGISEVGGFNISLGGKRLYMIQTAEKGVCWVKVRAKGRAGHASMPHDDNSIIHLMKAINRLTTQGMPHHLCEAVRGFIESASAAVGGVTGVALRSLKSPLASRIIFNSALKDHDLRSNLYAMLHNTATPTRLKAGYQTNVIPSEAEVTIDGRTLPSFDTESFLRELKGVLGNQFEYELLMESPPIQTRHDTGLFKTMASVLKQHDPQASVVPYMMSGATDAKYLAPLGIPTYGFTPIQMPPDLKFIELFHAHNERAPVAGLGWGARVLYEVVAEYCSQVIT
jgi:acetylornithine deacetylase/succinyl-diaminopimelate desuccinylase-like protein